MNITVYAVAWADEYSASVQQFTDRSEALVRMGSLRQSGFNVDLSDIEIPVSSLLADLVRAVETGDQAYEIRGDQAYIEAKKFVDGLEDREEIDDDPPTRL